MNRLKMQKLSITCRQSKTRLAQVDKQIAEIGAEIDRLINANNTLAHSMEILRSIPGIGAVCAATILIEMTEIGKLDRRQVDFDWIGANGTPLGAVARKIIYSG